jgi:hypothetical protein
MNICLCSDLFRKATLDNNKWQLVKQCLFILIESSQINKKAFGSFEFIQFSQKDPNHATHIMD